MEHDPIVIDDDQSDIDSRRCVCVSIHHRYEYSLDPENRRRYGYAVFHWSISVREEDLSRLGESTMFDVSNGDELMTEEMANAIPDRDWGFRTLYNEDLRLSPGHLVTVTIGKISDEIRIGSIRELLESILVPQRDQIPEQSCATWIKEAILKLQEAGHADIRDVELIMLEVLGFADYWMMRWQDGTRIDHRERFVPLEPI